VDMAKGKVFAPEFRQEAVRLYRVSGKPFRAAAEDLAIAPESRRRTSSGRRRLLRLVRRDSASGGLGLGRVIKRRAVATHTAVAECERAVLDEELVRDELLARPPMPGDHARDRLAAVIALAYPDADAVADPQPLATPCVVDVDLHGAHGEQLAR